MAERMVNLSPSLPMGLYERIDEPVSRGAVVSVAVKDLMPRAQAAELFDGSELGEAMAESGVDPYDARLVKRVVGLPGDVVTTSTRTVSVNGHVVGARFSRGKAKAEGCPFYWRATRHVLAADEVFLLSDDTEQFDGRYGIDSRYLGPIKLAHIVRVWRPVSGTEVKTAAEARQLLDRLNADECLTNA